jgi:hypothetical protein
MCENCPLDAQIEKGTTELFDTIRDRDASSKCSRERDVYNQLARQWSGTLGNIHEFAGKAHMILNDKSPNTGHEESADLHFGLADVMDAHSKAAEPFGVQGEKEATKKAPKNKRFRLFSSRKMKNSEKIEEKIAVSNEELPENFKSVVFTPKNTPFKKHLHINQKLMLPDYLQRIKSSGEEPSALADEAFGIGIHQHEDPHPSLLGRSFDQFFGIKLRPRVKEGLSLTGAQKARAEALSPNPEFRYQVGDKVQPGVTTSLTLGHLLQTPSLTIRDENREEKTLGSQVGSGGTVYENHPTLTLVKGLITEHRLYNESIDRLSRHPDIKVGDSGIHWTRSAHRAVQQEAQKFRDNVHELYHGRGVTLENGTKIPSLYLSSHIANYADELDKHFEPMPGHEEAWEQAINAFKESSKGIGVRTITERAHSPWSQVYDISFQRKVERSDDSSLKDTFKKYLGSKAQPDYVASAPTSGLQDDVEAFKTALSDRLERTTNQGPVESKPLQTVRVRSPRK